MSTIAVAVPAEAVAVDMHPGYVDAVAMPVAAMRITAVEMTTWMLSAVAVAAVAVADVTATMAVAVLSHGRVGSKAQGSNGQH